MTALIRPITPSRAKKYDVANVAITDAAGNDVVYMSRDRLTLFAVGHGGTSPQADTKLRQSLDDGVTWADVHTFPETCMGMVELDDGEVLVATLGARGYIYRSTGWQASRTAATWTKVFTTTGGYIRPIWALNRCSTGTNGVVVTSSYGAQTDGSGPASGQQNIAARYVYLSTDFGKTWSQIYDLYNQPNQPQATGCHVHSSAYDQEWDRIWMTFGDAVGQSQAVAGAGNFQIAYSDDRGATWTYMPRTSEWPVGTMQVTGISITKSAITFNGDGIPFGIMSFPRIGYRKLGQLHMGPLVSGNVGPDVIGMAVNKAYGDESFPMLASACLSNCPMRHPMIWISATDGLDWQDLWQDTIYSDNGGLFGITNVVGPTMGGKVVGAYTWTGPAGTWQSSMFKADLISTINQPTTGGGQAAVANGGTIPHGLRRKPLSYSVNATVPNRAIAITAADATNLTISLTDLTGTAIATPENVAWAASI